MFIRFRKCNNNATCNSACSDPSPANGSASMPRGSNFGEVAYISCDDGYVLQGAEQIVCESGPVWSETPICLKGTSCS